MRRLEQQSRHSPQTRIALLHYRAYLWKSARLYWDRAGRAATGFLPGGTEAGMPAWRLGS